MTFISKTNAPVGNLKTPALLFPTLPVPLTCSLKQAVTAAARPTAAADPPVSVVSVNMQMGGGDPPPPPHISVSVALWQELCLSP